MLSVAPALANIAGALAAAAAAVSLALAVVSVPAFSPDEQATEAEIASASVSADVRE